MIRSRRAVLVLLSVIVTFLGVQCTGAITFPQRVSDGYVFKASEKTVARIVDGSRYGVTLVDLSQSSTPDSDADLRRILAVKSNYSIIEGTVRKLGDDRLKIVTDTKITIDLTRKYGVYWGLDSKRLSDYLNGATGAGCGTCGGVDNFTKCPDCAPPSVLCCCAC
jgi:hypothetical protein